MSFYEEPLAANEHGVALKFGSLFCLHIEIVLTLFCQLSFDIIIILYSCTLFRSQLIKAYTQFYQIILLGYRIDGIFHVLLLALYFSNTSRFFFSLFALLLIAYVFLSSNDQKKFIVVPSRQGGKSTL